MKPWNFPGRIKARRESALRIRRRNLQRWEEQGAKEQAEKARREIETLERRVG